MTDLSARLAELGGALERAAEADLASARRPRRGSRRMSLAAALAVVALPAAAFATHALITTEEVARSLPAGTLALAGTNPTCEVVREGVEYLCTLERAPEPERGTQAHVVTKIERDGKRYVKITPPGDRGAEQDVTNWKGAVEATVDATKHVNGGCRSLASDGRTWRCYIGEAAVEQRIIGRRFLGEYAPSPGVG